MNVDHFSSRLPFTCHLEHDSKSAAHLELWNHPELDSAIVILLNRNLGGAIITDRHIHQGSTMHSGTLEHMCVKPGRTSVLLWEPRLSGNLLAPPMP